MYNYPQNAIFLYHSLKLRKMIDMHLKYDNIWTNVISYALISINNHLNSCINYMLLNPAAWIIASPLEIYYIISLESLFILWPCN